MTNQLELTPNSAEDALLALHLTQHIVKTDRSLYNCWGYVAYLLGWQTKNRWVDRELMNELLDHHTEVISQWNLRIGFPDEEVVEPGTVISWWHEDGNYLEHTSIVTGRDPETGEIYVLSKLGQEPRECNTLYDAWKTDGLWYGDVIKFHRVVE